MGDQYEDCRTNLVALAKWYQANSGTRNEATTRLHLIDELFFRCLGWMKDDALLETPHGGEYADYTFSTFRSVLIVEAKREGNYFELPTGISHLEYSIPSLIRDYSGLKPAILQAAGYCQSRGVPYGCVTNGHQIVTFVGSRNDGAPPLDGRSLVFESLERMVEQFLQLWQALSKPGIASNNLQYRLVGGRPDLPQKLSATLNSYPGLKSRNVLQTDLQILGELVIEDLIRAPEQEEQFLKECYCQGGALSQFALTSKSVLSARYAALFDSEHPGPATESATTKAGVSAELLGISLARRPILLLGDVGVGKTTFIRHLIRVEASGVFNNAITFHLDLGSQAALATDIRIFVLNELERQLFADHEVDVNERNFVRGVYNLELKRFATGIFADLRASDPKQFAEKELDQLVLFLSQKDQHLRKSLEHISKARKKQIVLFLDNADQRDAQTQEQAFLISHEFSDSWPMLVFVALRPDTFYRSKKIGALTGYHAKAFTISPPRIDLVLEKRLKFARKLTSGEISISRLQQIGLNLSKLRTIVEILIESLEKNQQLLECIDNIASGNVRQALDLVKTFIGSGHINTQKMLDEYENTGAYVIPLHEFLRAIIYGDGEYYQPTISAVANIFDIATLDGKEHFLVPLMLGILRTATGPDVREGFVETSTVYEKLQAMAFTPEQIDAAVSRACEFRLIETSARQLPEPGQRIPSSLRATATGIYHAERLVAEFTYFDAVCVDTPILDAELRRSITDAVTLTQRLDRAESFLEYLDSWWKPVDAQALGFDWKSASNTVRYLAGRLRKFK
jgi:hypothetical protein